MSNDLWQHIPPLHHSHLSLSESRLEVETGHLGKKSDVLAANCRAIKYGSLFFIYIYLILYMRIKKITFRNQSIYIYIYTWQVYIYIEDNAKLILFSPHKAFMCWKWYSLVLKRHCDCTLMNIFDISLEEIMSY